MMKRNRGKSDNPDDFSEIIPDIQINPDLNTNISGENVIFPSLDFDNTGLTPASVTEFANAEPPEAHCCDNGPEAAEDLSCSKTQNSDGTFTMDQVVYVELSAEIEPAAILNGGLDDHLETREEKNSTNFKKEDYNIMGLDDIMNDSFDKSRDHGCHHDGCSKFTNQNAEISVPVEITPNTEIGDIDVECSGEPYVCCDSKSCEGSLTIKIKQRLRIKIPIKYTFSGRVGEAKISCDPDKPCYKNY